MPFGLVLAFSGAAGLLVISLEILWYRAFAFASGQAATTGPLLVAASLAGFAEGAWFARSVCRQYQRTNRTVQTAIVCFVAGSVGGVLVIPFLSRIVAFAEWIWALPFVAGATAGFGAALTLIAHVSIRPDQRAGTSLSWLFSAAVAGAMLASLLTGLVLTQEMQTITIARCIALVGVVAALAVTIPTLHGRDRRVWSAVLTSLALLVVAASPILHSSIYERMLYKARYRGERFFGLVENRHGIVGVLPDRHIVDNGIDAGIATIDVDDHESLLIRAFAIPAMTATPRHVLMIGLGTGSWAKIVATFSSVDDLTIVDDNPEHVDIVSQSTDVAAVLQDSKVRVVVDDPRRWLEQHPHDYFDVIVSHGPMNWRAHASHLLSVEFMRLASARLTPSGLVYFNTADEPSAFRAAFDVFPNGLRFLNSAAVSAAPVGFDETRWRKALADYRLNGVALFDTTTKRGKARLSAFLETPNDPAGWFGTPALESRAAMLPRLRNVRPITDDNMGGEWSVGVRTPNW